LPRARLAGGPFRTKFARGGAAGRGLWLEACGRRAREGKKPAKKKEKRPPKKKVAERAGGRE